ncbi:MAG: hypothetical protein QXI02_07520 [Candidatus Caldarchaeum sp.]
MAEEEKEVVTMKTDKCPECGSGRLATSGGRCLTCLDCGWSSCPL